MRLPNGAEILRRNACPNKYSMSTCSSGWIDSYGGIRLSTPCCVCATALLTGSSSPIHALFSNKGVSAGLGCCCNYLNCWSSLPFSLSHPLPVLILSCTTLSCPAPSHHILFTAYRTFPFLFKVLPISFSPIIEDNLTLLHPKIFYPSLFSPSYSPLPYSSLFPSLPYTYPRSLNRPPFSLWQKRSHEHFSPLVSRRFRCCCFRVHTRTQSCKSTTSLHSFQKCIIDIVMWRSWCLLS